MTHQKLIWSDIRPGHYDRSIRRGLGIHGDVYYEWVDSPEEMYQGLKTRFMWADEVLAFLIGEVGDAHLVIDAVAEVVRSRQ